jgi:hypothetical protein
MQTPGTKWQLTLSSCLIGKCSSSLVRKRICGPDFEICEILFLKIWSRAILFLRPPMTRIRRGQTLPETHAACEQTPASRVVGRTRAAVADRRGRATSSAPAVGRRMAARGLLNVRLPDVGRAAPAGREGNFSSPQTLENKRNRIGIPPNPPVGGRQCDGGDYLAEPKGVATRLAQGRPRLVRNRNDGERRRFPGQSVASSRSRTLAASSSKENGLPIRCTPASSRPCWTIALRV